MFVAVTVGMFFIGRSVGKFKSRMLQPNCSVSDKLLNASAGKVMEIDGEYPLDGALH